MVYTPREDSFLLQKYVRQQAEGRVLDMGTGSGILALTAVKIPNVREVVAVDKDAEAVALLQERVRQEKIRKVTVLPSDLFSSVPGQFNVILFNPPYLPQDPGIRDETLYGGKQGWELSEKFFAEISRFLFPDGKILFLFSSLTKKSKIEDILKRHLFQFHELGREKLAFEELYVYLVEKTPLLRELEQKGISHLRYFSQGKRGTIYVGEWDITTGVKKFLPKKSVLKVAIKTRRESSKAEGTIAQEASWLPVLNRQGIGPRFLGTGESYFFYEFIEGTPFEAWLKQASRKSVHQVIEKVLRQCQLLDQLKVTKEEMHHPLKHLLIDQHDHPWLVDFERCKLTEKPQNVTQFAEYLCRQQNVLQQKGFSFSVAGVRERARLYKKEYTAETFTFLLQEFSLGAA